ncbi:MAG: ABC transporter ATP-binding protein [Deltaproteobacteria bacterium]|nr:ABC transporter ATP-binding protein [Deltaproteobacteria bacterium]
MKRYSTTLAVDHVSLYVRPGECVALLGPNGAGKTSTCEMLEGLLTPDEGTISICGLGYARNRREILELIGVQLQETQLYKKATVRETLQLFASFYRSSEDLNGLLSATHLNNLENRRLEALSGGQKQALYIACSLINRPRLLFLDEPSAGLDPEARRRIWALIGQVKQSERGIFLTTHYLEEAEKLADRVAIMFEGRLAAQDSPAGLIRTYCPGAVWGFSLDASAETLSAQRDYLKLHLPWLHHGVETQGGCELNSLEASKQIQELTVVARQKSIGVHSLYLRQSTLEDVFLKLTGRRLDETHQRH